MSKKQPISLYDLSLSQLTDMLASWNEPAYRAQQIYCQIYRRLCTDIDSMTDLPNHLRERLREENLLNTLQGPVVRSGDLQHGNTGWTRKALFRRSDGHPVESVLMIYPDRATVCVSTQSGCAIRCAFCATGQLGFLANLTTGQMIEQVLWAARELKSTLPHRSITNVVYMGMGEPFLNYEAWWQSVVRLNDPKGFGMGARSFTVSTAGVIPGILRLAEERLQVNLAVSLHAANDQLRSRLVPLNRKYPLPELLKALRRYIAATRRRVSLEYVLLHHLNDDAAHAQELADWCCGRLDNNAPLLCHVNLIPWNPVPSLPLRGAQKRCIEQFQHILEKARIPCTVRVQRGAEIGAACGQLAGEITRTTKTNGPA
jgi:23S rRNA (adenine2503-C2)-methyltransferase